ncbi:hypothetical protein HXX76_012542 [Chlamydomonas incerta]|uniref:Uncharacterized protein n=1 Tax=Chlamydomonas incerta TaxID=51695 RepID=A0A835VVG4_CHLIN|nr:hypothetical protein HXX76_012542 [Chlamydomonas incerta]|eukprot:KAG2427348.1 hypothetical protein HXX76_012542 [Chlamydomonas incerta]
MKVLEGVQTQPGVQKLDETPSAGLPDALTNEPLKRCDELLRLLHAVDSFGQGGLAAGYWAVTGGLRYLRHWLPALAEVGREQLTPPLDVAFAWLAHRAVDPGSYAAASAGVGPAPDQALRFGATATRHRTAWTQLSKGGAAWPPPTPPAAAAAAGGGGRAGSASAGPWLGLEVEDLADAARLAVTMQRLATLLRSWLRPHFLDAAFRERARVRYVRFLRLLFKYAPPPAAPGAGAGAHCGAGTCESAPPPLPLVPAADIALLWHTHLALAAQYAAVCAAAAARWGGGAAAAEAGAAAAAQQPGQPEPAAAAAAAGPWAAAYLDLPQGPQLQAAYRRTAHLYEMEYGEPYVCPHTAWLPPTVPYPLAAPGSPLAPLLRVYDALPPATAAAVAALGPLVATAAAVDKDTAAPPAAGCPTVIRTSVGDLLWGPFAPLAEEAPGGPTPRANSTHSAAAHGLQRQWNAAAPGALSTSTPPRAGAHALFAAWVAARCLARLPEMQLGGDLRLGLGCFGGCFGGGGGGGGSAAAAAGSSSGSGWSGPYAEYNRSNSIAAVCKRLGLILHHRSVPAWDTHPYLTAVRARGGAGLWSPSAAGLGGRDASVANHRRAQQEHEQHLRALQQLQAPTAGAAAGGGGGGTGPDGSMTGRSWSWRLLGKGAARTKSGNLSGSGSGPPSPKLAGAGTGAAASASAAGGGPSYGWWWPPCEAEGSAAEAVGFDAYDCEVYLDLDFDADERQQGHGRQDRIPLDPAATLQLQLEGDPMALPALPLAAAAPQPTCLHQPGLSLAGLALALQAAGVCGSPPAAGGGGGSLRGGGGGGEVSTGGSGKDAAFRRAATSSSSGLGGAWGRRTLGGVLQRDGRWGEDVRAAIRRTAAADPDADAASRRENRRGTYGYGSSGPYGIQLGPRGAKKAGGSGGGGDGAGGGGAGSDRDPLTDMELALRWADRSARSGQSYMRYVAAHQAVQQQQQQAAAAAEVAAAEKVGPGPGQALHRLANTSSGIGYVAGGGGGGGGGGGSGRGPGGCSSDGGSGTLSPAGASAYIAVPQPQLAAGGGAAGGGGDGGADCAVAAKGAAVLEPRAA